MAWSKAASCSRETNCGALAALPAPVAVDFPADISGPSGTGVLIAANGGKLVVCLAALGVAGGRGAGGIVLAYVRPDRVPGGRSGMSK